LTSHAMFNCCAYTEWVDWIIFWKSSSFSIRDVAFRGMFPTLEALRPNTCNNCFKVNLTKVGFGNRGHCFTTITSLSYLHYVLARMWLTTFWSFCVCMAMASPKMRAFILAWSWCQGPL
jgi:hypothetical protein